MSLRVGAWLAKSLFSPQGRVQQQVLGNFMPPVAVSAIITETPMVHDLEEDPFEFIEDGDFVRINANEGYIEIRNKDGL